MTRRQALAGLFGAAVLAGCRTTAGAQPPVRDEIGILEQRYGALIGVSAVNVDTGAALQHRADQRFAMCSTFKVYAAARVLQLAGTRDVDLESTTVLTPAEIVVNSAVTQTRVGSPMTLREMCAAALIHSDNTAGNVLLRTIGGPSGVTAFARSVGDAQSRLDRWEPDLNIAAPGDDRDTTTPTALGRGYREVLTGTVLSPEAHAQLLRWMSDTVTSTTRFRARLPSGWSTADKTGGGWYGSTNDAGLLLGPRGERIVTVVLTRSRTDDRDAAPLNDAIADTAALVAATLGSDRP